MKGNLWLSLIQMSTWVHWKLLTHYFTTSSVRVLQITLNLELCGEIDANIEESTSLLYDNDLQPALIHMEQALKKLSVIITHLLSKHNSLGCESSIWKISTKVEQ